MNTEKMLLFTNPATGEEFGRIPMTSQEEISQIFQELRDAYPLWQGKTVRERIRILREFQKVLIDSLDEITEVMNLDSGKTRQDAMIEVFMTVDMLDQYRKHAEKWLKPQKVSHGLYLFKNCYITHQPYGIVNVIAPWNYPLALSIPPVVSALIAGNVVVLKPSEVTGATGYLMEKLIERVPDLKPYIRVVHGDGEVGAALVEAGPDYIFLTGSTPTGRKVMQAAARNLTPVACELGGKDAMIVLEDAEIQAAATWGVWGSNFNAGQTCMAVERVYVVEQVYDEFVHKVLEEINKIKVGYSTELESDIFMGPITDPRQLKKIKEHLDDAINKGARLLAGGKIKDMFVEPAVLVDVNHTMEVMKDETFGPIMPIMKVRDEAEAIWLANDCDFGLGASVWSRDLERAQHVAQQIQASSVVINDTIAQFAVPMLPFGGIKHSGYGRIHGKEGLMQFTRPYAFAVGKAPMSWDVATILRYPGHYKAGANIMKFAFGVTPRQRLEPILDQFSEINPNANIRKTAIGLGVATGLVAAALGVFRLLSKSSNR